MIGGRAVKQRTSEIRAAIAAGDDSAASALATRRRHGSGSIGTTLRAK
jgi:hypothetical protein